MVRITETDHPHDGEVHSAVPVINTVHPLVWIPQLQAWFLDTSRSGRTPSTSESIIWLGNRHERENLMRTNMRHAANQHEFGFSNSNYQQRVFNNQTSNTGESIFGVNISDCGSLLCHNQSYAMNALNNHSSIWPKPRTYNEKVTGQENFCSDAIGSQCNLTNIRFQIPSSEYIRYDFQGVQLHGSRMSHDHVPRVEEIKDEFYGSQRHTRQHEFGLQSYLGQPVEKFYEDQLFEAADSSSSRNQVGDNRYDMDNSVDVAAFLIEHATETSHSQLSRSEEQDNGICNDIHDYRMKMDELPSVEELEKKRGHVVYIDEQQKVYLPSLEELGEELGFVKTTNEYDTGSFTESPKKRPEKGIQEFS